MKKITFLSAAAIALMMGACSEELADVQNAPVEGMDIVTAEMPATRTVLVPGATGVTVNWSEGDQIGVIYHKDGSYENVPYTLDKGAGTTSGSFIGGRAQGEKVLAYYPYNEKALYDGQKLSTDMGILLPMGGLFDPATPSTVGMKNASALLAMPVTLEKGQKYQFKLISGGSGQNLTGAAKMVFDKDGKPAIMMAEEAKGRGRSEKGSDAETSIEVTGTGEEQYVLFPVAAVKKAAEGTGTEKVTYEELKLQIATVNDNGEPETTSSEIVIASGVELNTGTASVVDNKQDVIAGATLETVIKDGGKVTLDSNVSLASLIVEAGKEVEIDLNGKTLEMTGTTKNVIQGKLTVKNGLLKVTKGISDDSYFAAKEGGVLTFDGVKVTAMGHTFISAQGPKVVLNIIDSEILFDGYFCLSTNASVKGGDLVFGDNATITLTNSTFKAQETALMNNVPAKVTIDGCSFSGNHQAALMRGGEYSVSNSTFILNAVLTASHSENKRMQKWESGNKCAFAAITAGNYLNTSYQYPTILDLKNCKVNVGGTNAKDFPAIHVCANQGEGKGVTLTYDADTKAAIGNAAYGWTNSGNVCIEYGTTNIKVNGKNCAAVDYKDMEP